MTDTTTRDARAVEAESEAAAETDGQHDGTRTEPEAAPGPAAERASASTTMATTTRDAALFDEAASKDLQGRWQAIQVGFVDEPRGAVEQADKLVDEVMKRLADSFARERDELERAWSGGSEASTEDLRQAIRRYRSFFNRLLGI